MDMNILATMQQTEIPPMTHELSSGWYQPDHRRFLFDESHVLMRRWEFEELMEYSCSQPSGVYDGKMWKRHNGIYDQRFLAGGGVPEWLLCWFGPSDDPDCCSTFTRKILLVD